MRKYSQWCVSGRLPITRPTAKYPNKTRRFEMRRIKTRWTVTYWTVSSPSSTIWTKKRRNKLIDDLCVDNTVRSIAYTASCWCYGPEYLKRLHRHCLVYDHDLQQSLLWPSYDPRPYPPHLILSTFPPLTPPDPNNDPRHPNSLSTLSPQHDTCPNLAGRILTKLNDECFFSVRFQQQWLVSLYLTFSHSEDMVFRMIADVLSVRGEVLVAFGVGWDLVG